MNFERLDKIVSNNFGVTRKIARNDIKQGKVSVDGRVVTDFSAKIAENIPVNYNGQECGNTKFTYIMMNKPKGVLTATRDDSRETVLDLVPEDIKRKGLFPVGRLDKDTTGLLIITNDGDFAHRIVSPRHHVAKVYTVTLDGTVTDDAVKGFLEGVTLADGELCAPAILEKTDKENVARVTLREGKYHQIKRMFGVFSLGVNDLTRNSIGDLVLDPTLREGECRVMTQEEIKKAEEK
ncbi:MAG: 16S rRNA pseudouridine(516) synthase [Clostridia bacterium]|nr:16S rRNA pseudouridine(516) synthase [Clostridia bacterium]